MMNAALSLRNNIIRYGTFPLFAFGPGLLVIGLIQPLALHKGWNPLQTLALCSLIVATCYVFIAWLERVLPYREDWNHAKGDVRADILHLAITGPASAATGAFLVNVFVLWGHGMLPDSIPFTIWPTAWHPAAQVALAILVAEFGHYWIHRIAHEVPLIWRLHAIHHSAQRLYWLNASRFHPLDLLLIAFCQVLPLMLLGIPPEIYLAYSIVAGCYGQLQHCNIDVRTGVWRWLFATPELHRWHHSPDPREGNTNYGAIFISWDYIFRSFFWPGKAIESPVGIGDMPNFPSSYREHLLAPFRWNKLSP